MPQLRIIGPEGAEQWLELEGNEFSVGRDPKCDIPLQDKKVSRNHARIFSRGSAFFIEDLGSANGVLLNGNPIRRAVALVNGTELEVGPFAVMFQADPEPGEQLAYALIGLSGPVDGQTYQLPAADIYVGRGDDCDIVIPDGSISRQHGVIEVNDKGMMVEDLGSSNGTFVNDQRVAREPLRNGDRLKFGSVEFEVSVEGIEAGRNRMSTAVFDQLKRADSSVKLAAGMGLMTVVLLMVVIVILIARGRDGEADTGDPFVDYERQVEMSIATARAQLQAQSWKTAVRAYQDVLDQDPINPEARRGLSDAISNQGHQRAVAAAKAALSQNRPEEVLTRLTGIPGEAFYGKEAARLLGSARKALHASEIAAAQKACRKKEYRNCHARAITALTHQPNSSTGRQLVGDAEKGMKNKRIAFVPFAP